MGFFSSLGIRFLRGARAAERKRGHSEKRIHKEEGREMSRATEFIINGILWIIIIVFVVWKCS